MWQFIDKPMNPFITEIQNCLTHYGGKRACHDVFQQGLKSAPYEGGGIYELGSGKLEKLAYTSSLIMTFSPDVFSLVS